MHRSASMYRTADELLLLIAPHLMKDSQPMARKSDVELLPKYDLLSSKKELMPKGRTGERAVHVIPLILLLCVLILWFFSHPVSLGSKGDSSVAKEVETKIASDTNELVTAEAKKIKYPDTRHHIENHQPGRGLENSLKDPSST